MYIQAHGSIIKRIVPVVHLYSIVVGRNKNDGDDDGALFVCISIGKITFYPVWIDVAA